MKFVANILLSIVLLLFPTLIVVNFLQLSYAYTPNLNYQFLQAPTDTYFGFRSFQLLAQDFNQPMIDIINEILFTWNDFTNRAMEFASKFEEGSYFNEDFSKLGLVGDFDLSKIGELLNDLWFLLSNVFILPFELLYIVVTALLTPFVMIANLIRMFLLAIGGAYNIPIVDSPTYEIPSIDVWDTTFRSIIL